MDSTIQTDFILLFTEINEMLRMKTDLELGLQVSKFLREKEVEHPFAAAQNRSIAKNFKEILITLGLSIEDDSLKDTPARVEKMYLQELFYGLEYANFPKITTFPSKHDGMVVERNMKVISVCEHHFQTIYGVANVAYIPKDKVVGLSKLNRVVDFFARRPQVQERLTDQIYYALSYVLGTEDIAVHIKAKHFCVIARGVQDINSDTITSKLGGIFRDSEVRAEFLSLLE